MDITLDFKDEGMRYVVPDQFMEGSIYLANKVSIKMDLLVLTSLGTQCTMDLATTHC